MLPDAEGLWVSGMDGDIGKYNTLNATLARV